MKSLPTPSSGPAPDPLPRGASRTADPTTSPVPAGEFVTLDGEAAYRISAYHRLQPFLMAIASDSDLWMFVTSGGGLTAGRRDADGALFPYETVDKLHDGHHHTGPITLIRVDAAELPTALWEPFHERGADDPRIERQLYKNVIGNRLVFEETNHELGLRFRYRWSGSDEFGLVRTASLENVGSRTRRISLLDGLRNVLPYGAPLSLYQDSSCLVDAYKRVDCDPDTRLGIFSLTSEITDRPEAAEELRANTVWCHGLGDFTVALSLEAVAAFRRGDGLDGESALTGRRGNYLASASLALAPGASTTWHIAADVGRSHVQIAALRARLFEGGDLGARIEASLRDASENLRRIVGSADGLQLTGHAEASAHHFTSVLFNNMRGGVFARNYDIPTADLLSFLEIHNRTVVERHGAALRACPAEIPVSDLLVAVERWNDADLLRLCYEYLPIYFGRRHGDPSRPWNRFAIRLKNPDGSRALSYEGNWRDIFQNWEALCFSFPQFLPGVIAKFVNASTADGFNPYRITRDGIDWEIPDPRSPWSHIGYWGDHQIIYLLRFLEALSRCSPGKLESLLAQEIFCHAEVPYRLKPYERILEDPRSTIDYDEVLASRIEARVAAIGTDGKLVRDRDGSVRHVNLLEKLLIPALSKLSNFVPGGGIWMNTQRPEWNDANNALVGNGVSMVTLFHLRRYLRFVEHLAEGRGAGHASLSREVAAWLRRVRGTFDRYRFALDAGDLDARNRKTMLDELGAAFSDYRDRVASRESHGAKETVALAEIVALCRSALDHIDHAIHRNRREDGLYHSYNLLELSGDRKRLMLRPLEVMLEGQVAALSSGVVKAEEALALLTSLFASRLYRPDQRSFMLYPEKDLPSFLERNHVPDEGAMAVPLLRELLEERESSILTRDALGVCRFQGDLRNALDLSGALDRLAALERWKASVARDRQAVLALFEDVFRHREFTGRSGAMYAYEGLGSIYWHMVSKLLLAVQEIALGTDDAPPAATKALADAYERIRAGLGFEKSVTEYGAFPTDPYSHTPAHAGAQQPGMTGQVKEDILARFGELGVVVAGGRVSFHPRLLRRIEFLRGPAIYRFHDVAGNSRSIEVPAGSLAFSFCQVPVIYESTSGESMIRVTIHDGSSLTLPGGSLDLPTSQSLFGRKGEIARIDVTIPRGLLRHP